MSTIRAARLSGYWEELKNNVRGSVAGSARGSRVHVLLKGAAFSATLDLVTSGNRQSVTITPGSDTQTQVQRVAISHAQGRLTRSFVFGRYRTGRRQRRPVCFWRPSG